MVVHSPCVPDNKGKTTDTQTKSIIFAGTKINYMFRLMRQPSSGCTDK